MMSVRPAAGFDADGMARLLNAIIEKGGTTALTRHVTGSDIAEWMAQDAQRSAWHVAVDETEEVQGFQWICPNANLPSEAADIATFVRVGQTGLGIGSSLFSATAQAAARLGYVWINAEIRADNEGGLIYYQSRGFRDYGVREGVVLEDGQVVDKRLKRYDV
ncbi:GNAT family N-acetyltransferase [Sulfitobacter sp. LCG007]